MKDKFSHIINPKAVEYIIYSTSSLGLGFGDYDPEKPFGLIRVNGTNTARGDLGTTCITPEVLDKLLLDENFTTYVENKTFIILGLDKKNLKEKHYYLSSEGKKEIKKNNKILLKDVTLEDRQKVNVTEIRGDDTSPMVMEATIGGEKISAAQAGMH